jgi:cyclic pyranopterin phosphate synthase
MIDAYGRTISYLRLSVTDRCDLRCTYCMPQAMRFLPRAEMLSLAELDRVASAFIRLGVRKLRLTGGEPLMRKGVIDLVAGLSRHLASGALDELTMTTNGTRLAEHAAALAANGVKRVNVSLDTLDPATFARLTRGGDVARVIAGIDAALAAGLAVKLNTVALRDDNLGEAAALVGWAHDRGCAISFIEVMPMGDVEARRSDQHVPLNEVRAAIEARWPLTDLALRTGGPARYARTAAGGRVGFITPLSNNFCGDCNRVRLTCTGQLFLCLGRDVSLDLRAIMRGSDDDGALDQAIARAMPRKPREHDFHIDDRPADVARHMSVTGG